MPATAQRLSGRVVSGGEVFIPATLVAVVIMMVIPMPTWLLDLMLTVSISLALIILLVAMYILHPLEFSSFPSVLLVATLFRLSLNVSSTRLILLHGSEGSAAAGHVIESFGAFVVGGSYVVGLVVFLILVVINFAVITKGSGRIAEVAARFTLDAMPGKQLSIDADLNAGIVSEREARERRRNIEREADFYGAMDGASKFVRGDAVAGLIITAINILGGIVIGVLQQGVSLGDAARTYTTLTIGDGLVSQLPALLTSTAAGVIVTRAASGADLGTEVTRQLLFQPRVLVIVGGILIAFAVLPGLPFLPFMTLGGLVGAIGISAMREAPAGPVEEVVPHEKPKETAADVLPPLDLLEIEVGYELVALIDADRRGDLVDRIRALRRQMAQEMGFVIPPVHIRDNLQRKPGEYGILLKGVEVARGEMRVGYDLAMNPTGGKVDVPGIPTKEPAFGLDALWVAPADRERAQLAGLTVVDVATVIITHLTEVIRRHAPELLTRQEVQGLLDVLARTHPKAVEDLVPQQLSLGGVQKVLQNLLREGVSIRDLLTVVEALADHAPHTKDPDQLTEYVRQALARSVTRRYLNRQGALPLVSVSPAVERLVLDAVRRTDEGMVVALEPAAAQRLLGAIGQWVERFTVDGYPPVLLCSTAVRPYLRRFIERYLPTVAVLSPAEIDGTVRIHSLGVVSIDEN